MMNLETLLKDITNIEIIKSTKDYIIYSSGDLTEKKEWIFFPETSSIIALNNNDPDRLLSAQKKSVNFLNSDKINDWFFGYKPKVSAVNLNLTSACNLNCIYCYAAGGDYERLSSNMSLECFEAFMQSLKGRFDMTRPVRFEFFGGEPLLNEEVIEKVLDW